MSAATDRPFTTRPLYRLELVDAKYPEAGWKLVRV